MGTNYYYFEKPPCKCCNRAFASRHIGKSSGGWAFSLHVYPEDGIYNLEDWRNLFERPETEIRDEYDGVVTPERMLANITERARADKPKEPVMFYGTIEQMARQNHAVFDYESNLMRYQIGRHCIGHGAGTYDFIVGEFS